MVIDGVTLTEELVREIKQSTSHIGFWRSYLRNLTASGPNSLTVHLAILAEPYLRFILDGSKTVESRFSKRRVAPYGAVRSGDVILMKRASAKGLRGICVVSKVWYYSLTPDSWRDIRSGFSKALCASDPDFWETRRSARFATLMRITEVTDLPIIDFAKRDRRGWAVLRTQSHQLTGVGSQQEL